MQKGFFVLELGCGFAHLLNFFLWIPLPIAVFEGEDFLITLEAL